MMPENDMPTAVAVIGPTASGKTSLSIALGRAFDGEVISCDSMQIYKGMDIGTAKPAFDERMGVPHHMFDVVSACDDFSVADYSDMAWQTLLDVRKKRKLPIFCGGTGLYLDGVISGRHSANCASSEQERMKLQRIYEKEGAEALHAMLAEVDPEAADATHPNNIKRVIRALEIYYSTGVCKTEWDRRSRENPPRVQMHKIGLRFNDRSLLYDRINQRVDIMIERGLVEEARALRDGGPLSRTAVQAIGYKELFEYFDGNIRLDEAIEKIKTASRNYAKRQLTWFSRYDDIFWIDVDSNGGMRADSEIFAEAEKHLLNLL